MTAAALIQALSKLPPDRPVVFDDSEQGLIEVTAASARTQVHKLPHLLGGVDFILLE